MLPPHRTGEVVVASSATRNRVLAGVGVSVFVAMLAWALSTPSSLGGKPQESAEAPVTAPPASASASPQKNAAQPSVKPAPAPTPAEPPVNLFADPMPDFMSKSYAAVLDKKWLDADQQKELYNWGKEHKDDARPQLILAWESMNRDWKGLSVRMYRMAYRADHRAKDDPSMLRDLLHIASQYDTVEYREASDVIRDAYGEEALPKIDDAIAQLRGEGAESRAERLQRLRGEVTSRK
jgi:hypothetical protein